MNYKIINGQLFDDKNNRLELCIGDKKIIEFINQRKELLKKYANGTKLKIKEETTFDFDCICGEFTIMDFENFQNLDNCGEYKCLSCQRNYLYHYDNKKICFKIGNFGLLKQLQLFNYVF